ncbi:hypothetical protein [Helicobacter mesocricetorum]|uniref:hypothetical protein n=1 Tax=Helicobacter mesocricetorum TaxID=87012 RepID=UPI000CF0E86D|nr:hypothetical protein [Helicobacter mesocricetorum]
MYSLTLWLGIPGERRIWLQQWEGIPLILKNLSRYFPSIKVYVDGLTAYDGERIEVQNNLEAFWKIVENTKEAFETKEFQNESNRETATKTNPHLQNTQSHNQDKIISNESENSCILYGVKGEQIAFKSLSGYDYRTKICYGSMCNLAISECSTTSLVPFYFCQKPGVVFGLADTLGVHSEELARNIPFLYAIDENCLITTNLGGVEWIASMPPEHLYNLAAQSLEGLSKEGKLANFSKENPLKMHRLSVPPVELYAKKHALEEKYKVKFTLQEIALHCELLQKQEEILRYSNSTNPKMQYSNSPAKPTGAALRVKNHLAYKIGQSLVLNSKSLWGYIRMFYVLSYIKALHSQEQEYYEERVAINPNLKLPLLEDYADYQEGLKVKEHLSYQLGESFLNAYKNLWRGGLLKFWLVDSKKIIKEFKQRK